MSLLSLDQALIALQEKARLQPIKEIEQVSVCAALGRVLAEPLIATTDLPPWANSAMDGYALRQSDLHTTQTLVVSQKIFAGHAPQPLQAGTCARIFTGAPLPAGADSVEMQENTEVTQQGVRFLQPVTLGQYVRPQGQECQQGQPLLSQGTRLSAIDLALATSVGVTKVGVYRKYRVALLSTGDELVEAGQALQAGQIYNSNRTLLLTALTQLGCDVQDIGILPDDPDKIRHVLREINNVDLILSTGGVSVGEADYLGQILREEGQLSFWKLALKPGKPLTFGYYKNTAFLGLPGNPASSLVTFAILARPYILACLQAKNIAPLSFSVTIGFDIPQASVRREYLRVRVIQGVAQQYDNQCSGVLRSAAWADGLLVVRENQCFKQGDQLAFIPFSELFN